MALCFCVCMCSHVCVCGGDYVCVYMLMRVCTWMCMYACWCVGVYVCLCMCVCVYPGLPLDLLCCLGLCLITLGSGSCSHVLNINNKLLVSMAPLSSKIHPISSCTPWIIYSVRPLRAENNVPGSGCLQKLKALHTSYHVYWICDCMSLNQTKIGVVFQFWPGLLIKCHYGVCVKCCICAIAQTVSCS